MMDGMTKEEIGRDPVLNRFRHALSDVYGDRLERVVLFGSRARGEARPDSDYDIAVFLYNDFDHGRELFRLADIGSALLEQTGEWVHALPFPATAVQGAAGTGARDDRPGGAVSSRAATNDQVPPP